MLTLSPFKAKPTESKNWNGSNETDKLNSELMKWAEFFAAESPHSDDIKVIINNSKSLVHKSVGAKGTSSALESAHRCFSDSKKFNEGIGSADGVIIFMKVGPKISFNDLEEAVTMIMSKSPPTADGIFVFSFKEDRPDLSVEVFVVAASYKRDFIPYSETITNLDSTILSLLTRKL